MGTDIHGWTERNVKGRWIAVAKLTSPHGHARNYKRFAALAGVRGEGPVPRGLPVDIADTTKYHVDDWGADGYCHSWLPLAEALLIFQQTERHSDTVTLRSHFGLQIDFLAPLDDYRLVFWFDS